MAQYRVLIPLPISSDRPGRGKTAGDLVELSDDEARVFLLVGSVEAVDDSPSDETRTTRRYRRRDLQAVEV